MVYSSLTLQQIYILAYRYFSPFFLVLFNTYYIRRPHNHRSGAVAIYITWHNNMYIKPLFGGGGGGLAAVGF